MNAKQVTAWVRVGLSNIELPCRVIRALAHHEALAGSANVAKNNPFVTIGAMPQFLEQRLGIFQIGAVENPR